VQENRSKVERLERDTQSIKEASAAIVAREQDLNNKLAAIQQALDELAEQQAQQRPPVDDAGIPIGFGFDHLRTPQGLNQGTWHDPLDRVSSAADEGTDRGGFRGLLAPPGRQSSPPVKPAQANKQATPEEHVIDPAYTVPKDSILYDGVALTALVGRIPVEGTTPDPYPVKILIGKDNLAANGHILPDVDGMLFSGIAIGDWNLSCVSVRLTSATYIFHDGSVVNHSSQGKPIGYISDRRGWPCVEGDFRTNAIQFLQQRITLAGIGTASAAYAEAQRERQTSSLTGNTTSTVTGNIDKLVAGTVVQSATDEVSEWMLARQKQSFDAVIVEPGAAVSIHLDQALTIDHDSLARRTIYASSDDTFQQTLD